MEWLVLVNRRKSWDILKAHKVYSSVTTGGMSGKASRNGKEYVVAFDTKVEQ